MTKQLSGGEVIAHALEDEGVEFIFGYPGGAVLHIYDALFRDSEIPHILVRHEQAATHAADAYTRATGKTGVVLVTSGPGATNAVTGIATAYMDSIPMVVLSGQVQSHLIGDDAFQECDMVGISRPIVKHSFQVRRTEDIAPMIKKAFLLASSGRPGPVVIDVPKDLTHPDHKVEYDYASIDARIRSYVPPAKGHTGQIKKAVSLLLEAKKPVIYSGGGVVQGEASEELIALAKRLDLPVTNTLMGLGAYPGTDDRFLGMLGMHGTYEANTAMHNADLILALGARFDDRVTNIPGKFCPDAKIIHVDIDPAAISKTIRADIPIVGPVKSVLTEFLSLLEEQLGEQPAPNASDIDAWNTQIEAWKDKHGFYRNPNFTQEPTGQIKPQHVLRVLEKVTGGDAYICSDVGQHQMFAAQWYRYNKPRRWINSGGLGTMGFGLPAAMGCKLADYDAQVVCITGEGSIQMNIQELATCTQYGLPVKIVNLNNQALGMVKQWQDMQYEGRYSHSTTYAESLPDFVKLAESYGHVGMVIENVEDLEPKLAEAMAMTDKLVFIDIKVDPTEHVYPMQIPTPTEGAMKDMWLSKTERT